MPLPLKAFYMIRHGETEANRAKIMAGSLDSPLTDTGRAQAAAVQNVVQALPIRPRVVVHSPLSRARDTAGIINEALNAPMHEDADIAELHAGDWEGAPYEECAGLLTGWPTPPNGESFDQFCTRIKRGKSRILDEHEGPVLIVSHGGVFRALGGLYGLKTPGIFQNCHLYEFQPAPKDSIFPWVVHSYSYGDGVLKRQEENVFHVSDTI